MAWTILVIQWTKGTLYLDPGSGSILLQLLIAAVAGGALAVKIYWKKIKSLFKKENNTETSDSIDSDK